MYRTTAIWNTGILEYKEQASDEFCTIYMKYL